MAAQPHTGQSHAVEDYSKAIFALQARGGGQPVTTNDLAERLGVTPASASAMVKRMDEHGLVAHVPYRGVTLTEEGRRIGLEVLRHHRLLELFLVEHLGVPLDRVHEEAEALEHVLSEDLERRIATMLGNPTLDPHGDPIPSAELEVQEVPTHSLDSVQAGARGRFVRVSDSHPEMLRYLDERGIAVGDPFELVDRQPFDGPLTVRFARTEHVLGAPLARTMRVELDGG